MAKNQKLKKLKTMETAKYFKLLYGKEEKTYPLTSKITKQIKRLLSKGKDEEVIQDHFYIEEEIKEYTENRFYFNGANRLFITGEKTPVPRLIADKIVEFHNAKLPVEPLLNFWEKLKKNPDKRIQEQLYGFMQTNDHPITWDGYFLAYKGVTELDDGTLVDSHSRSIRNDIGKRPKMPRNEVDNNPQVACSTGLHVASYGYATGFYGGKLIEVLVDPVNVVSVPTDYSNQKMRVCEYEVISYGKTPINKPHITREVLTKKFVKSFKKNLKKIKKGGSGAVGFSFAEMPAKQIIELVKTITGEKITISPKSKASVVRAAEKAFQKQQLIKRDQCIVLENLTSRMIVDMVRRKTKKKITFNLRSKRSIIKKAKEIFAEHGLNELGEKE